MAIDHEALWRELKLDELGIDAVRAKLAAGVFGTKRRPVIEEWLRRQDQLLASAEAERSAASNAEQLSIARSAKDAAWAAADAARDAARNAKNANAIAIGALIVATIGAAPTIYAFIRSLLP